jgi:predicted acylesterase/phospholipase RssA
LGTIWQVEADLPAELRGLPADLAEARGSPFRFCADDGTYFLGGEEIQQARATGRGVRIVRRIEERELGVRVAAQDEAHMAAPPEDARLAVLARLLAEQRACADVEVRFLGRNQSVPSDGFVLDRAGGKRSYVWRVVPAERAADRRDPGERFRALRDLAADPGTRTVLALGSGGLKLFAHAPLLRLLERIGVSEHVEELWGSSGGAVVALLYSHGLSPQAIEQAGYDLYTGRYEMALRPSRFQVVRNLLRDALLPSPDASSAGFLDLGGALASMLDHYCTAIEARRPFYCVAFNLAEGRPEVLTPAPVPEHLEDWLVRTDPREAALASSAVPLLSLPRRIRRGARDVPYVDGSTTEDVPIWSAARKWDLDRSAGTERRERLLVISVKLTTAISQYKNLGGRFGKVRLLQTVAAAGIQTMHERDVALLSLRPDVSLVSLHLGDENPDFFDVRRIPGFIRAARESFPEQLAAIDASLRTRG